MVIIHLHFFDYINNTYFCYVIELSRSFRWYLHTSPPPAKTKARYRSRKGDYATNVLGVCSRNLRFIYALSGWEGSATDSRVLANALVRPHGLKIPQGT